MMIWEGKIIPFVLLLTPAKPLCIFRPDGKLVFDFYIKSQYTFLGTIEYKILPIPN